MTGLQESSMKYNEKHFNDGLVKFVQSFQTALDFQVINKGLDIYGGIGMMGKDLVKQRCKDICLLSICLRFP